MGALKNFFRYLPLSQSDLARGLYVSGGGYALIPPGTPYPPARHPRGHHFSWARGRALSAHQIVYVSRGGGRFESAAAGSAEVRPGDVMLLFPGVWHRYAPHADTGWDEHWVEFGGPFVRTLYDETGLDGARPVVHVGGDPEFLGLYSRVMSEVELERVGHQHVLAATTVRIIAEVGVTPTRRAFRDTTIERAIERAKAIFAKSAGVSLNMEEVAERLDVGYTWFRRMFKEYTGMSPGQYHLQLRVGRARRLLENTSLTVSQIADACGFTTDRYFVRLFREKTGTTPGEYRKAQSWSAGDRANS